MASSVDSSQSNPSESLSSFWVSITFLKVGSFYIARIHCRFSKSTFVCSFLKTGTRAFSVFTRATFSDSPFPSYSLINALNWVSWRFSASSKMRDQGSKLSVSSWEDSVPQLACKTSFSWEKSLSSLYS